MYCPRCNHKIDENYAYCSKCGCSLNKNNTKNNSFVDIAFQIITSLIIVGILIFIISTMISYNNNSSNLEFSPKLNKSKNCEDSTVKNLVIEIFKENNEYYLDIDKTSIADITLIYPATSSYDSTIDKYSCTGIITMTSTSSGFLPKKYDTDNLYYNHIYSFSNYGQLYKYTKYKQNVSYDSQISEGNTLVSASNNLGEFSCNGTCGMFPDKKHVERQLKQQEKVKKENQNNELNLPE